MYTYSKMETTDSWLHANIALSIMIGIMGYGIYSVLKNQPYDK